MRLKKIDKFQALRDQAAAIKGASTQVAVLQARQAEIGAVVRALCPPPPPTSLGDLLDAMLFDAMDAFKKGVRAPKPFTFNKVGGISATSLIVDDVLTYDKLAKASATLTANEVNARRQALDREIFALKAKAQEAREIAEVADALRDPRPNHDDHLEPYANAFRYASGLNIARPSSIVLVAGV